MQMDQTSNPQKSQLQQISEVSFTSAPNRSFSLEELELNKQNSGNDYCFIVVFIGLGFYFLIFAIIELATNFNQIQQTFYLNRISNQYISESKFVSFDENNQIAIYLKLQSLTQLDIQLSNKEKQTKKCHNYQTNQQMQKNTSITLEQLNPSAPAIPCGKYLSFYPEGQFEIINSNTGDKLQIDSDNLVNHDPDVKNVNLSLQWADLQSQRFKSWYISDSQIHIKKLWGRVSSSVSGQYYVKMTLNNEIPQIDQFVVELNNNEALGGYNAQLCYINFFFGILLFAGALSNFLVQKKWGQKKNFKKKQVFATKSNQIKIFLSSHASTPAVKID